MNKRIIEKTIPLNKHTRDKMNENIIAKTIKLFIINYIKNKNNGIFLQKIQLFKSKNIVKYNIIILCIEYI